VRIYSKKVCSREPKILWVHFLREATKKSRFHIRWVVDHRNQVLPALLVVGRRQGILSSQDILLQEDTLLREDIHLEGIHHNQDSNKALQAKALHDDLLPATLSQELPHKVDIHPRGTSLAKIRHIPIQARTNHLENLLSLSGAALVSNREDTHLNRDILLKDILLNRNIPHKARGRHEVPRGKDKEVSKQNLKTA